VILFDISFHLDYTTPYPVARRSTMAQIIISVPQTNEAPRLQVSVHIQAEVLSAETARRRANVWLLENVGNLLRAESPELVLSDRLVWRMDIVLTSPSRGRVGRVGRLELEATTGDILADETLAQEIIPLARALIAN
jgi:hypothetical protein